MGVFRGMNELRNLLMQQQHRIAEKEELIARILNSNSIKTTILTRNPSSHSSSQVISHAVNPNANQHLLRTKVRDL